MQLCNMRKTLHAFAKRDSDDTQMWAAGQRQFAISGQSSRGALSTLGTWDFEVGGCKDPPQMVDGHQASALPASARLTVIR